MVNEWILNSATNRFQLNYKRNVGATSLEIRKCAPKSVHDWEEYYFNNVRTEDEINDLGKKLYVKISEVLTAEIEEITEKDCVDYIRKLVINRTYEGYIREIETIHGQLDAALSYLNVKTEPAPDEWDRGYNVDFYIQVGNMYVGLQIKPLSSKEQLPIIHRQHKLQLDTHARFKEKYGGEVFYVYSAKSNDGKKQIVNSEVIDEIAAEINRLRNL